MTCLRDELEDADELIRKADQKLGTAAEEIEQIAEEHSTLSARPDIEDGTITVSVNHQATVKKLNEQLPYPLHAKVVKGNIEIVDVEVEIDEKDPDNLKQLVAAIERQFDRGAPADAVLHHAQEGDYTKQEAEHELEKLKQLGEVYVPADGRLRST